VPPATPGVIPEPIDRAQSAYPPRSNSNSSSNISVPVKVQLDQPATTPPGRPAGFARFSWRFSGYPGYVFEFDLKQGARPTTRRARCLGGRGVGGSLVWHMWWWDQNDGVDVDGRQGHGGGVQDVDDDGIDFKGRVGLSCAVRGLTKTRQDKQSSKSAYFRSNRIQVPDPGR
jgi:hypothetical protein